MAQDRGFFEKLARRVLLPEESAVQDFLQKSEAFKKMKQLAVNAQSSSWTNGIPNPPQEQSLVADIEKVATFSGILDATDRMARIPKSANVLLFLGGYINNEANFAYYALQFRNAAITKMVELGYSAQPQRPSASY